MQIDGWDIPENAKNYYNVSWNEFLRGEAPATYLRPRTINEHVSDAERLANNYGGLLPRAGWLQQNGYFNLYNAMRKYPDRFAHISQDGRGWKCKKLHRYVLDAEKLASKHNGLPTPSWLQNNGYVNLIQKIYKYPDRFAHIERQPLLRISKGKRTRKSLQEWRTIAIDLAKRNGGRLPGRRALADMGYEALYSAMRFHSDAFKGIQGVRTRSINHAE